LLEDTVCIILFIDLIMLQQANNTTEEVAGNSNNKTSVSTPSSSTSGCVSGHDEAGSPVDRGWLYYIPPSIVDGQSRFGFIEVNIKHTNKSMSLLYVFMLCTVYYVCT
jgi:hypothetical protein